MPFEIPYVSAFMAGVLLIMQMLLTLMVVLGRRRNKQSLGDGGEPGLLRAIRRHGNFAENAAIFLAGFALFEMLGGPRQFLELLCIVFLVARLCHAVGLSMTKTSNFLRVAGAAGTIIVGITLGGRLIALAAPHVPLPW